MRLFVECVMKCRGKNKTNKNSVNVNFEMELSKMRWVKEKMEKKNLEKWREIEEIDEKRKNSKT